MFTTQSVPVIPEEQLSPELKIKDTLETITHILSKSSSERTDEELKRLTIFLTRMDDFSSFWDSISQDLQPYLLREFRCIEVRPGKSLFFLGGPIQCVYFLLKGSICAFNSPKTEDRYRNDSSGFLSYIKRRNNVLKRPATATSLSPTYKFSPVGGNHAPLSLEEIFVQYPDHKFIRRIEEGEGFGDLVSKEFCPKANALITRETCQLLVLNVSAYKRILAEHNKQLQSQTTGLLRKLTITKDLNSFELQELFYHSKSVSLGRNHVLYDIGDPCEYVYVIQAGEVEISKEMKLDLEDEEILDKGSIVKQNLDIDRSRLVDLNPKWKKKFTMAKKQQVRVALLGSGQSFGEEEFLSQSPPFTVRYTKAIVKSLTAQILIVPVEKIFKYNETETVAPPVTRSITQPVTRSGTQLLSTADIPEKVIENDSVKLNLLTNSEVLEEESQKHKRSASFGSLTYQFRKTVAVSNDKLLRNKQALLNNFGITFDQLPTPEDTKENVEVTVRKKSFVCKSPRNEVILSSRSPPRVGGAGGIKRLWESNLQTYFSKSKKAAEQQKNSQPGELRKKPSLTLAPEKPSSMNNLGKTGSTRYITKPVIMSTFAVTTKSFRAGSPVDHMTTSLGHQTLLEDEPSENTKTPKIGKIVIKKSPVCSGERKSSAPSIKSLGKIMSPIAGFREKSIENKAPLGEIASQRTNGKARTVMMTNVAI